MARTSIFRPLTRAAVLVSLVSTLLLFAAVTWTVTRESERTLAATIDTDIAGLADLYLSGGEPELIRRVGDRIALSADRGESAYYLVAGPEGRRHAGNLTKWPALSAERSQLGTVRLPDGSRIIARATQFPGNVRIVVGRTLGERQALLRRLAFAFLAAGLLAALLSLLGGMLASRRLRTRLAGINDTLAAIEAGEMHRRAPGWEAPDELGDLAARTNRTLEQVERLIAAQRDVGDNLAHEVRTPLMHLDTQLRKAIERTVDPRMIATLGEARADIRQLAQLLDSLLDIAGAEAMKGDVRGLGDVDLSAIAENIADLYEVSAEDLGLAFTGRIAPGVVMRGEPMQLTRLLTNLLDNAFKYVPAGGNVRLRVEAGPRILVEDDGPGIPEADRPRIFERHARSGAGGQPGHGLGLSLARAIAERHGLAIRVEDAAPGARFIVAREGEQ